jgi:iron(III) transport system permease protein
VALAVGRLALDVPGLLGLYQSFPLLLVAYGIHFGAPGLRAANVAVGGVPRATVDAARLLGAGTARRVATVDLPLMRPGLLAGGGLVLLSAMKELPATLLLAPTGTETLATRIWSATEALFLGEVGVTALALLAVSTVLTWLLVIRGAPG